MDTAGFHADAQRQSSAELGRIFSVQGSQASVGLAGASLNAADEAPATVGKFVGIRRGSSLLIGMITEVSVETPAVARELGYHGAAKLDLLGEIKDHGAPTASFQRGVSDYPAIGDPAILITNRDLRLLYDIASDKTIDVGLLHQDSSIHAYVDVNEMLSKHFAVLGTTGVGKSSGVALLLREILRARPDLRVFLLDGHNEYGRCFGDQAQVLNPRNVKLPFWLFNFEEFVDVIFGGRPGPDEEVEILGEVIPVVKSTYSLHRSPTDRLIKRTDPKTTGYTVDTPVPYRLQDLVAAIDERMGRLENRSSRMNYHRLMQRIESVRNDPRYAFMFDNANVGGDTMADVLRQLFRIPTNGRPMTIMQLAGFPAEVVDSVVSVLGRMAFEFGLWSDGAIPVLFVCEEAHRYASADRAIGFGPTRKAISRIAKEGRKYGVFLGLVTQRPAELDATIISQCSTLFAMRMANDRDQALVRSAVSDAAANLLAFVPSLGTREVIAFGEGVALPTRLKFTRLPDEAIPRSEAVNNTRVAGGDESGDFLTSVIERWRGATMNQKGGAHNEDGPALPLAYADETPSVAPAFSHPAAPPSAGPGLGNGLDPDRFKILKRPVDARAEPAPTPRGDFSSPFLRR